MRRETRNRSKKNNDLSTNIIKYVGISVGILALIVIGLLVYSKNLNDEVKKGSLNSEQLATLMNNTTENSATTEKANSDIGKTVDEALNEYKDSKKEPEENKKIEKADNNENKVSNEETKVNSVQKNKASNSTNVAKQKETPEKKEVKIEKKELNFVKPVEGEILKDFSKDNLVYSETLQEWTTHTGLDIKAEKTTVVKAAEKGVVKSIKNDPRYGLTIVVEHEDGFQTVYANLLTSEFVVENEKVEKGQSLGTVGNTAAFEVADEPHLHFEIIKDSIQVDPKIYLK